MPRPEHPKLRQACRERTDISHGLHLGTDKSSRGNTGSLKFHEPTSPSIDCKGLHRSYAESQSAGRADFPGAAHSHRQKVQRDVAQRLPHTDPARISGCSKTCDIPSSAPFSSTPVHYPGASVNFDRRCRLSLLNNRNHSSFDAKQPTEAASHYSLVLRCLLL